MAKKSKAVPVADVEPKTVEPEDTHFYDKGLGVLYIITGENKENATITGTNVATGNTLSFPVGMVQSGVFTNA